ncbi:MAG: YitT family protein [Lachnospiraceae bacterium]|nr:YitT family protein [Lachnospiraceae bacterium]
MGFSEGAGVDKKQKGNAEGKTISKVKGSTEATTSGARKGYGLKRVGDYIVMTLSAAVYGMAIGLFSDPNMLAPGGVAGTAVILSRILPLETGTLVLIMNIPIFLFGLWQFGIRFMLSTIYSTFMASMFINFFGKYPPVTQEPLLAALVGGALAALGLGMTFRSGSTTGGTDIIVKYLRRKMPFLKTGILMMSIDVMVVTASAFVFGDVERALYAGISVGVTSFVLDLVLYGRDGAKLLYIISDNPEMIAKRLLEDLDVGVTYLEGVGGYSGKEKQVIFCVLRKPMSPKAEAIVKEEDPRAFMIVTNATEIYGEGYKSYFGEKL